MSRVVRLSKVEVCRLLVVALRLFAIDIPRSGGCMNRYPVDILSGVCVGLVTLFLYDKTLVHREGSAWPILDALHKGI